MWNALGELLKVSVEPRAADAHRAADAPVGEPLGEQALHQPHRFERNGWPGVVEGELMTTDPAQVSLFASMGVAVFDDADGSAVRTVKLIHDSLNHCHS